MHCPGLWHKRPEAPSLRVVSVRARPPGPVSARADSQSRPGHRGSGPGQKHSVQEPEVERQGEREEVQGKKHGGGGGRGRQRDREPGTGPMFNDGLTGRSARHGWNELSISKPPGCPHRRNVRQNCASLPPVPFIAQHFCPPGFPLRTEATKAPPWQPPEQGA